LEAARGDVESLQSELRRVRDQLSRASVEKDNFKAKLEADRRR
jgi:hypothetical protein